MCRVVLREKVKNQWTVNGGAELEGEVGAQVT